MRVEPLPGYGWRLQAGVKPSVEHFGAHISTEHDVCKVESAWDKVYIAGVPKIHFLRDDVTARLELELDTILIGADASTTIVLAVAVYASV